MAYGLVVHGARAERELAAAQSECVSQQRAPGKRHSKTQRGREKEWLGVQIKKAHVLLAAFVPLLCFSGPKNVCPDVRAYSFGLPSRAHPSGISLCIPT
jgi:hypothetical protein